MGIIDGLKKIYKYLYEIENYTLKEDELICGACDGTGHEDIFHNCKTCSSTGVVKRAH